MKIKTYILSAVFLLLFFACSKKENTKNTQPDLSEDRTLENDSVQTEEIPRKESINLFTLTSRDSTDAAFVSLSDIYPVNEDTDTDVLPDITKMDIISAEYFILENKYRKRFLAKTTISETDSLFVYDYTKNKLASFAVKNLRTAALVNGYTSEQDFPYERYDYMIGFEISKQYLNGLSDYYADVLVYVGKENPFTKEALTPIAWKKISNKEYPSKALKKEESEILKGTTPGSTYAYKTNSFIYFLQDYLNSQKDVYARRLFVVDSKTKDIIIEKFYSESEGTSPSPLNFQNNDNIINQYTGKLFKNKPPVVFGFQYESFGCPAISLIDKSNEDIYLQCDNRH